MSSAPASSAGQLRPAFSGWLARIPPVTYLLFAAVVAALSFALMVLFASRTPWLGLQLTPEPHALVVSGVVSGGPGDGVVAAGERLVALRTADDQLLPLTGLLLLESPHVLPDYPRFNDFLARHRALFAEVAAGPVTLILDDGREVRLTPQARRPLRDIPVGFWLMAGFSALVLQIGVGVWAFRHGIATRLLMLSSIGYLLLGLPLSVYASRELTLAAELLFWLPAATRLGALLFGFSVMALFWYFPKRLSHVPVAPLFMVALVLIWLNETWQLIQLPLHAYAIAYFPIFALGVAYALRQWRASRHQPDERAALLWIVGSALLTIGMVLIFYFLPLLFGGNHMIPFWAGELVILGLYAGVVLGVLRFRLFDLERWWFAVWGWFIGGVLVVVFDLALVYFTSLQPAGALTVSLLVAVWLYFPLRQWAWSRFMHSPSARLESLLPLLLDAFFAAPATASLQERWQQLLSQVFEPLHLRTVPGQPAQSHLENDGLVLAIADIDGDGHLLLSGRNHGRRLFTRDDVALATIILTLARKSAALREAQERGAALERERIARDLHDDVAPQLLTLAHTAATPENAERARNALQTLRESIYTLSDNRDIVLEMLLAEWRVEAADRCEAAGVHLRWQEPETIPPLTLTSRQRLNLTRILREALSNALRHALPTALEISITLEEHRFTLTLRHDGNIQPPPNWRRGKGLNNMQMRIEELGGTISWQLLSEPAGLLEICWTLSHARDADGRGHAPGEGSQGKSSR